MKCFGMLLAAGLVLVGTSGLRAEEARGVSGTMELAPLPGSPQLACCGDSGCGGHGVSCSRFRDWLCYKPKKTHCACHCAVTSCISPLYLWFLDMCPDCGHGGCANACGGCAAAVHAH
jgi:hypothetical protein